MRYLPLFRLELVHDYYDDGRCPDFAIEPAPGTQELVENCRGTLRSVSNGTRCLVPVNESGTPFVPLPSQPVFRFQLRALNPDFSLFSDLTELEGLSAPVYTNAAPARSGDLGPVSREAWQTERFVVQQPAAQEPFVLGGRPADGTKTADAFVVEGLGPKPGRRSYEETTRIVRVNTSTVPAGTPFTITYPITPRLARGVFADVEIRYDNSSKPLSGDAAPFRIVFRARQARWKYYVVTDKNESKPALPSIEDGQKTITFDSTGRTDLTQSPDPADTIAAGLAEQYPNRRCFRLISNAPVPCRKTARKNIQLYLNDDKVIDALPNPALQSYTIDTNNTAREYTLYQIVKYFTP
jgi:hypothetical protein